MDVPHQTDVTPAMVDACSILHDACMRQDALALMYALHVRRAPPNGAASHHYSCTPLTMCAALDFVDGVRLLVNAGADVWRRDAHGMTALGTALAFGSRNISPFLSLFGSRPAAANKRKRR